MEMTSSETSSHGLNSKSTTTTTHNSSVEEKTKKQIIVEAFESAETVEEKLSAVKELEAAVEDGVVVKGTVGKCYMKIAGQLFGEGGDREKVIEYCRKAVANLELSCDDDDDDSDDKSLYVPLAMTLQLLGWACGDLEWWSDSVGYLKRAETVLRKLEKEGKPENESTVNDLMLMVQQSLVSVKCRRREDGEEEDSIGSLSKCLEIQELSLGKRSLEVGDTNRDLGKAYVESLKFKEALPCCLKAFELHESLLGSKSVEVVRDRLLLGVVYTGLEEKGKALEQNQLVQEILKGQGLSPELLHMVIDAAEMYTEIGKSHEAVQILNGLVSLTDGESIDRARILIYMAKAMGDQKKLAKSKKSCLKTARRILESKEGSYPLEVCRAYDQISMVYQEMKDYETTIFLLKKSLALLEKLPEQKAFKGVVTAGMGWVLRLAGEMELSISYFEDAVEIFKETFGKMHSKVGGAYNNIGCAYMNLGRPESAAPYYLMSLEIAEASLGPRHWVSIDNYKTLSEAYSAMGNYDLAIKYQEKVVEAWKAHGASRKWEYQDAQYTLDVLKKMACCIDAANSRKAAPPS